MNNRPDIFFIMFWEIKFVRELATNTPSRVTKIRAKDADKNTVQILWVFDVITIAVSCVLSPSSAKNTIQNVVKKELPIHIYISL